MKRDFTKLSEQELRDLARQLEFDAEALVDRKRKVAARIQHDAVVEELRLRYPRAHPVKTGVNRFLARLTGADTDKVERHLRSAGRDQI